MEGGRRRVLVKILELRDRYQVGPLTFIILILSLLLNLLLCTSAIRDFYGQFHFLSLHIFISIFLGDEHLCSGNLLRACYLQAHKWEELIFHLFQLVVKLITFR